MKRLLRGGRVVDPANGRDGVFDILIDGDRIERIAKDIPADGANVIETPLPSVRSATSPARAAAVS